MIIVSCALRHLCNSSELTRQLFFSNSNKQYDTFLCFKKNGNFNTEEC